MVNRKKVILHCRDGWGEDSKLALTPDQVKLMEWMFNNDMVDVDTWDLQVLEEAEEWEEV